MVRIISTEQGMKSLEGKQVSFAQIKAGTSPLAQDILHLLSAQPSYSHEIAKQLGVHEQKVYYHMRRLEESGLIEEESRYTIQGGSAKYYRLAAPSFALLLKELEPATQISMIPEQHAAFLHPFIVDGKQDFQIIVGSAEAHGPSMTRAKDGSYAIDLALFLGSYCDRPKPVMKLDTELRDWKQNLVIIGGPIVNMAAAKVNPHLPVKFLEDGKTIYSEKTGKKYDKDEIGIIVKAPNPLAKGKHVLFIAGRRQAGTKAAILAFVNHFNEILGTSRVVEGRDEDSDGVVDEVVFCE